ncbi:hypothetical protein WJX74_006854 [Apatococcus lobatus]|uniref:Uncharacterized protein n=1 Tax=Apatococcus lobatus TaxID=904363 RepID=A0AAW1QUB3_9CHLO
MLPSLPFLSDFLGENGEQLALNPGGGDLEPAAASGQQAPPSGSRENIVDEILGQLDPEALDSLANELVASGDITACCPEDAGPSLCRALQIDSDIFEHRKNSSASGLPNTSNSKRLAPASQAQGFSAAPAAQQDAASQPQPHMQEWQVRLQQRESRQAPAVMHQPGGTEFQPPIVPGSVILRPSQLQSGQAGGIIAALEAAADSRTSQQQPDAAATAQGHIDLDASAHFSLRLPAQDSHWQGQQYVHRGPASAPFQAQRPHIASQKQAAPQTQRHASQGPGALGLRQAASQHSAFGTAMSGRAWQDRRQNAMSLPELDDPLGWHLSPEPETAPASAGLWSAGHTEQHPGSSHSQPLLVTGAAAGGFPASLEAGSRPLMSGSIQHQHMQSHASQNAAKDNPFLDELLHGGQQRQQQEQQQRHQQQLQMNRHAPMQTAQGSGQLQRQELEHQSRSPGMMQLPDPCCEHNMQRSMQHVTPAPGQNPIQQLSEQQLPYGTASWQLSCNQDMQNQQRLSLQHRQQHMASRPVTCMNGTIDYNQGIPPQRPGHMSSMQQLQTGAQQRLNQQQRLQQQQQQQQQQQIDCGSLSGWPGPSRLSAGHQQQQQQMPPTQPGPRSRAKQREAHCNMGFQGQGSSAETLSQLRDQQQAAIASLPGALVSDQHMFKPGLGPHALQPRASMSHDQSRALGPSQPATSAAAVGLRWDTSQAPQAGAEAPTAQLSESIHAGGALTVPESSASFAYSPAAVQRQLAVGAAMLNGLPLGVPQPSLDSSHGSVPVQAVALLSPAASVPHWQTLPGNKLAQGGVVITEEDGSQVSAGASEQPAGSVAQTSTPPVREATPTGTVPKRPRLDNAGPSIQDAARKEQMTEEAAAAVIKALEPSLQRMQGQMENVKMFKQVLGEREKCIKGLVGHMYDVQHQGNVPVEARENSIFETVKAIQLLRQGPSKSKQVQIPLDPNGSWEEVAQLQGYSYHAFIYAWLARRTETRMHVDLGPLKGTPTLQQLSELDSVTAINLQNEYRDKLGLLMREAKGNMMSAAGRQFAALSLQRMLVTMSCETSLRKPHMGLGSAQLEALRRIVQRQQLPMYLVDEGLVTLTPAQMDNVLKMRDKYCENLNQILQDRLHLLDFINKRLLNMEDPAPCTLVASADAEVAAFDAVTHLQENLTAHVDNFVEMLSYGQTIYTPFQAGAITALSQSIDDQAGDHLAFAEAIAVRKHRTPLTEQMRRFGPLFAETNPHRIV